MQNRYFGRFLSSDATQNYGVSVILRDSVVNKVDAIVGGLPDVLRDVGVVVLRSHRSDSVTGKMRYLL